MTSFWPLVLAVAQCIMVCGCGHTGKEDMGFFEMVDVVVVGMHHEYIPDFTVHSGVPTEEVVARIANDLEKDLHLRLLEEGLGDLRGRDVGALVLSKLVGYDLHIMMEDSIASREEKIERLITYVKARGKDKR